MSPQIQALLGGVQWGWSHDQVIEFFRQSIAARVAPQLRNRGLVEQDRIIQARDQEVDAIRRSIVEFDGAQVHRGWDTSLISQEFTHNNGESMLIHEDPQSGEREFFFFISDRLWKRFRVKSLQGVDFLTFLQRAEQLFGPGMHRMRQDAPDRIEVVLWQDETTRLRLVDNTTFYNAVCFVTEDRAMLARLGELRRNLPPAQTSGSARPSVGIPQVGNVEGDANADVVDRLVGRRSLTAPAGDAGPSR